ncbi:MAG: thioredoxin fold domain-containing protein [Anaerolineales bacterium]
MAAKPIVDGIEREHEDRLKVIRLNIQDPAGEALLERFEFRFTPTFIFFDETGEEVQRWLGAIDSAQVRQLLENPSS